MVGLELTVMNVYHHQDAVSTVLTVMNVYHHQDAVSTVLSVNNWTIVYNVLLNNSVSSLAL